MMEFLLCRVQLRLITNDARPFMHVNSFSWASFFYIFILFIPRCGISLLPSAASILNILNIDFDRFCISTPSGLRWSIGCKMRPFRPQKCCLWWRSKNTILQRSFNNFNIMIRLIELFIHASYNFELCGVLPILWLADRQDQRSSFSLIIYLSYVYQRSRILFFLCVVDQCFGFGYSTYHSFCAI